jgi:hypothetical protein
VRQISFTDPSAKKGASAFALSFQTITLNLITVDHFWQKESIFFVPLAGKRQSRM